MFRSAVFVHRAFFAAIVTIAGSGVCRLEAQQSVLPAEPSDVRVRIDGAREVAFADAFDVEAALWQVKQEAPTGRYAVSWSVEVAAAAALRLKGELFQGGAGQNQRLQMTIRGGGTECFVLSDQTGEWQVKQTRIFDPVQHVERLAAGGGEGSGGRMTLAFYWSFSKPGRQPAWRTALRGLVVEATDAAELVEAFCAPMAEGFPPVALPPARGVLGDAPWKVVDNVLTKNGEPFFPIGFVFGTDDRTLGQVRAMGANAVHTVISWPQVMPQPAPDQSVVEHTWLGHARIGRWGLAGLPLVEGHYVPDWFAAAHPQDATSPLGADGNKTGSWFPYSIHYEPMRAAMKQFWQALAPGFGREPSVLAVITWNEPIYGGHYARPRQFADYRDFAVENYRTWLQTQYASLAALNQHWGTDHASWEQIEPPRGPDETNRRAWYDWARYGQSAFAGFFEYIGDCFHDQVPDLWMIHKPTDGPFDGWACSSGTNYYLMGRSSPHVFGFDAYTRTPGTVALARAGATDKPVFQLETNSIPPTAAARNPRKVRNWMWNFMIGGLRGMFIFAMSTGQYGLLNDAYCDAETRPTYAQFVRQVSDHGHVLALNDAPARIAILHSNDAVLHYPGQRPLYPGPAFGAYHLVKNSHFNVVFVPQERCTLEVLSPYEVLVLPSYTILTEAQIQTVERFVNAGGKLLAFSHALEKNETFEDLEDVPPVFGLAERSPVGEALTVSVQDEAIAPYVTQAFAGHDAERIETVDGRTLATTVGGQAAAVLTRGGSVVYCAWRSDYDEHPRRLVEGLLREVFGVRQTVRLVSPDDPLVACGAVGTRLIREPGRDGAYHLLVHNGGDERSVRLDSRVPFERERFYGAHATLPRIELPQATAYLLSQAGEK